MLQLTPNAVRYLINVRKERGVDNRAGARFVSKEGRVGLTFALAAVDGDRVVDADVIKVYVASEIAAALDESIIDARDEDGKTALIMRKQAEAKAKVTKPVH
jgi:Fe-S cluster assembly iron-binding protein IscA